MLAGRAVAYDAIFPKLDLLARIPKEHRGKDTMDVTAPQYPPDGDALLVVQNANDPTASVVLLRHGTQTLLCPSRRLHQDRSGSAVTRIQEQEYMK